MPESKYAEGVRIAAGLNQRPDILSLIGPPPFKDGKGVYIATAIFGGGIAHPCKFSPHWDPPIHVEDNGDVWQFFGKWVKRKSFYIEDGWLMDRE